MLPVHFIVAEISKDIFHQNPVRNQEQKTEQTIDNQGYIGKIQGTGARIIRHQADEKQNRCGHQNSITNPQRILYTRITDNTRISLEIDEHNGIDQYQYQDIPAQYRPFHRLHGQVIPQQMRKHHGKSTNAQVN